MIRILKEKKKEKKGEKNKLNSLKNQILTYNFKPNSLLDPANHQIVPAVHRRGLKFPFVLAV